MHLEETRLRSYCLYPSLPARLCGDNFLHVKTELCFDLDHLQSFHPIVNINYLLDERATLCTAILSLLIL